MPYNPGVTDRSGEFIASGISQAGAAIGSALQDFATSRYESDYLRASLEMLGETNPDLVTAETLEKFDSGSLGSKRAMVSQLSATANRNQELELQREKMAMSAQAARDRHNLSIALAQFKHDLDINKPRPMPTEAEFFGREALVSPSGAVTFKPEDEPPPNTAGWEFTQSPDGRTYATFNGEPVGSGAAPPKVEETGPPVHLGNYVVEDLGAAQIVRGPDGKPLGSPKWKQDEAADPYGSLSEDDEVEAWWSQEFSQ